MAKVTKAQLKGIVKECLVEILSEGLSTSGPSLENKKAAVRKRNRAEAARLEEHRRRLETRVTDTVSHVTDDPIMQSILADTAKTTLQDQLANEKPGSPSQALQEVAGASPGGAGINLDSIFGSPKENWSTLAFSEKKMG